MKKKQQERESNNFQLAFLGGGTDASADCEYCGRTYFCTPDVGNGYEDESEYEALVKKAKANALYVEVQESISYTSAFGKQYIWGCPCRALKPYEELFLAKRHQILAFYQSELRDEQEEVRRKEKDLAPFQDSK